MQLYDTQMPHKQAGEQVQAGLSFVVRRCQGITVRNSKSESQLDFKLLLNALSAEFAYLRVLRSALCLATSHSVDREALSAEC